MFRMESVILVISRYKNLLNTIVQKYGFKKNLMHLKLERFYFHKHKNFKIFVDNQKRPAK